MTLNRRKNYVEYCCSHTPPTQGRNEGHNSPGAEKS